MENSVYTIMDSGETQLFSAELSSREEKGMIFRDISIFDLNKIRNMNIIKLRVEGLYPETLEGVPHVLNDSSFVVMGIRNLSEVSRKDVKLELSAKTSVITIGEYKERYSVIIRDISCTGIRFECSARLESVGQYEVVIPITNLPLVLRFSIIRVEYNAATGMYSYGSRFLNLFQEEEKELREAIFSIQKLSHKRGR